MRSNHGTASLAAEDGTSPSTVAQVSQAPLHPGTGDSKAPGHGFAIPLRLQAPGPLSMLFVLLGPDTFRAFTHGRGWPLEQRRAWVTTTLERADLVPSPPRDRG
jgi:hypothetical protein